MSEASPRSTQRCDFLIVGAGPAGLAAAGRLSEAGLDVILIDKKPDPAKPVRCAELVPKNFLDLIPFRLDHLCPSETLQTVICGKLKAETCAPSYMLDRLELSYKGRLYATANGCRIILDAGLVSIQDGSVKVSVDGGQLQIKAKAVIAADGPGSRTARAVGIKPGHYLVAAQVKIPIIASLTANMVFFEPEFVGGYGWVFGGQSHLSIGAGWSPAARISPKAAIGKMMSLAVQFVPQLEQQVLLPRVTGIIPCERRPLAKGNCLFVGDAAGLAHPITGAGITNAVVSGLEAADSLAGRPALSTPGLASSIASYSERIERWLGPSLHRAEETRQRFQKSWTDHGDDFIKLVRSVWFAFPESRHR